MLGREIWDKLSEYNFKFFKNYEVDLSQKSSGTNVITGYYHQTNRHFVLKLISFDNGQLQNNTVNVAMSILIDCAIIKRNLFI